MKERDHFEDLGEEGHNIKIGLKNQNGVHPDS